MRILILDGHSKAAAESLLSLPRDAEFDVAAVDQTALAWASRRVSRRLQQPDQADALGDWLARVDADRSYDLIIPSTEASLLGLRRAGLPDALRAKAVLPGDTAIDVALSKVETARLAADLGIAVPTWRAYQTLNEARETPPLGFPLVVKPQRSKVVVDGRLRTLEAQVCGDAIAYGRAFGALLPYTAVLVQEYFAGRGVGVEMLFEHGRLRWLFAHERVHELPVTGGASSYRRVFQPPPAVNDAAIALLTRLQWHGVAMVEFKVNAEQDYRLIEINPRLWGSVPLATAAGVNFPLGLLKLARGQDPGPQPKPSRVRYARDVAADLRWFAQSWRHRKSPLRIKAMGLADVAGWLRVLSGTERWDLFRWSEPELWWALSRETFLAVPRKVEKAIAQRRAGAAARRQWANSAGRWRSGEVRRVMVLCYGNICRSPVVERALKRACPDLQVRSAGFHRQQGRATPQGWAECVRSCLDMELADHESNVIDAADLEWAELVLVMDADNWRSLVSAFPSARSKATLLTVAAQASTARSIEVQDPYGQDRQTMELIARQLDLLVGRLAALRTGDHGT